MTLGSSVAAVKEALHTGFKTALGESAVVWYDAPADLRDLVSDTQEWVGCYFDTEFDPEFQVPFVGGPVVVTQEDYELRLILLVLDKYSDPVGATVPKGERGIRLDRRLDEMLGTMLTWLNDRRNLPSVAGDASEVTIEIVAVVEGSGSRVSTVLAGQPSVRMARLELPINVSARRQIVTP